jgi:cytochrome d ubiquinol oxidase subunit I
MAAVGAFYLLAGRHTTIAPLFLRVAVPVGLLSSVLVAFPTGDTQAKLVARYQPVTLAAMEGRFESGPRAGIHVIGQPNVAERRLDNPIQVPGILSFLAFGTLHSNVRGLDEFPEDTWPDNIELLYYSFHIMITLGTIFILLMGYDTFQNWRGRLESSTLLHWVLMLAFVLYMVAGKSWKDYTVKVADLILQGAVITIFFAILAKGLSLKLLRR